MASVVLLPEKKERHTFATQLAGDAVPVRRGASSAGWRRSGKQTTVQVVVGQTVRQRPRQSRRSCPAEVVANRTGTQAATGADSPMAQSLRLQTQDLSNFTHG